MAPQRAAAKQRQAAAASGDAPAARTQAAVSVEQQRAATEMAPLLLLQHDSIRTQLPLVCKLLCCSKWLAAAVAEHSAGQLDMPRRDMPAQAEQAVPWLRKHARLVRSLDLRCSEPCVAVLVAALTSAGPQSLMLQSLTASATNTTLPLLEQLPASRLTHLVLQERPVQLQDPPPAPVARVSAALGRLTALRSLVLIRRVDDAAAPLLGLSALTELTALSFCGPPSDLQHAPPQLLELELTTESSRHGPQPPQMDLRHLAAATALTIPRLPVREGDVLPPNLLRLQIDDCRSAQPLLPLVQLRQLQLKPADGQHDMTADQLRQLSRLTALTLDYVACIYNKIEPASAGAWPTLSLRQLQLFCALLPAPLCQHLAQVSGLTSLELRECELPKLGSAQQLAAALVQLSGLQRLELSRPLLASAATSTQAQKNKAAAGMLQLVQAVGCLQHLRDLDISSFKQLAAAAGANSSSLSALTALTGLCLPSCDLTDAAATAIVSQLPGLQSLDCCFNSALTDAVLPAIRRLQQLTKLSVQCTAVTDAGLLTGGLQGLCVSDAENVMRFGVPDDFRMLEAFMHRLQQF